jgi:lysophospholipase L1-like esterase
MIRRGSIGAVALIVAACGSGSKGPMDPTTTAPQIACPSDVTVPGITGSEQPVTFPAPTVTGGTAPLNLTCTQSSGASFPLGTTAVTCTATDATARQAACAFNVTLTALTLAVTKYDTIGDSLTEGENALPSPTYVDTPNAYPTRLQALFDATYPGQGINVVNHGAGGERIEKTLELLPEYLTADRPQAVLLLGGYNNLTTPCEVGLANTSDCRAAIEEVAFGVRDCIREIKESPLGIEYIFVGTLTPPGSVTSTSKDRRIDVNAILAVNSRIRQMVTSEAATLVDIYPLFAGHEAEYVSIDGLHLQPAGYQAIADAFFTSIKATVPQTALLSINSAR